MVRGAGGVCEVGLVAVDLRAGVWTPGVPSPAGAVLAGRRKRQWEQRPLQGLGEGRPRPGPGGPCPARPPPARTAGALK